MTADILALIRQLPEKRPLVHMIPNGVSAAFCADAMAAAGARPVMADSAMEAEEITSHAGALAANLGQPSPEKEAALRISLETAASRGIPAVFDPVGAGASSYRQKISASLLQIPWSGILKGNASEFHTLLTGELSHQGVDSIGFSSGALLPASKAALLAAGSRVLAVTGKQDLICRDDRTLLLSHRGSTVRSLVGTGCAAGALCASFAALTRDYFLAAAAALSLTSFALWKASGEGNRYGSCKARFLDAISGRSEQELDEYLHLEFEFTGGQI